MYESSDAKNTFVMLQYSPMSRLLVNKESFSERLDLLIISKNPQYRYNSIKVALTLLIIKPRKRHY